MILVQQEYDEMEASSEILLEKEAEEIVLVEVEVEEEAKAKAEEIMILNQTPMLNQLL